MVIFTSVSSVAMCTRVQWHSFACGWESCQSIMKSYFYWITNTLALYRGTNWGSEGNAMARKKCWKLNKLLAGWIECNNICGNSHNFAFYFFFIFVFSFFCWVVFSTRNEFFWWYCERMIRNDGRIDSMSKCNAMRSGKKTIERSTDDEIFMASNGYHRVWKAPVFFKIFWLSE